MTEPISINPNTASQDELRTLTGIGPALADRILAARPFSNPEDMLRVTGISPALLEKVQDRLVFDPPPDSESAEILISEAELDGILAPETTDTAESTGMEKLPEIEQETGPETGPDTRPTTSLEGPEETIPAMVHETSAETAPAAQTKSPVYITRSQAFWMTATVSFFTFILAVALTLSILSAMNNGLRFASTTDVRNVQTEIRDLQSASDTLEGDVEALRTRMDNFETLGGRVATLETSVETLGADLDSVAVDVDTLSEEVTAVSDSVETLREDAGRFQSFLDGLTKLLLGLAPEETNE